MSEFFNAVAVISITAVANTVPVAQVSGDVIAVAAAATADAADTSGI